MRQLLFFFALSTSIGLAAQNTLASTELEAKNINQVKIDGSFCDIYVEKGNRNYLKGSIEGRGNEGDFEIATEIDGSTLFVRVLRNDRVSWKGGNLSESKIELTIVDGVQIDIDNSSGDIYASGINATGSKIEATSGDITLRSITANLKVKTSSGDIAIEQLTGDLKVKSTSGDQEIEGTKGAINSIATSGDIDIEGFEGNLSAEATSGDVKITEGTGNLTVNTTTGNIEGSNVKLTGNANFKASSGDVSVDFDNDISELSFDLTASSGDLRAGGQSGEKKLYIDRGGYRVTGVTSSGDQEYN